MKPEFHSPITAALRLGALSLLVSCSDGEPATADAPAAAPAAVDTALAPVENETETRPAEIYFDLTAYAWYREGRPLVHNGRSYAPQAEPTVVSGELREAGRYEGVSYYAAADDTEPVYTLYVPVYYRYWQRFTSQPGS